VLHTQCHTLDPPLLSFLVVPVVRELRSTRSCDFLNRGGGFIKVFLEGSGVLNRSEYSFCIDGAKELISKVEGNTAIVVIYPDRRSMEDIAYTASNIPTGVPFCGRLNPLILTVQCN
jgi:hypothetical protein